MFCIVFGVHINLNRRVTSSRANTDWRGDKLAGEELRNNNAKTLRARLVFSPRFETSTAFRLLTPPGSVLIVAPLQSVGEFSRVFSSVGEKLFCKITVDS